MSVQPRLIAAVAATLVVAGIGFPSLGASVGETPLGAKFNQASEKIFGPEEKASFSVDGQKDLKPLSSEQGKQFNKVKSFVPPTKKDRAAKASSASEEGFSLDGLRKDWNSMASEPPTPAKKREAADPRLTAEAGYNKALQGK